MASLPLPVVVLGDSSDSDFTPPPSPRKKEPQSTPHVVFPVFHTPQPPRSPPIAMTTMPGFLGELERANTDFIRCFINSMDPRAFSAFVGSTAEIAPYLKQKHPTSNISQHEGNAALQYIFNDLSNVFLTGAGGTGKSFTIQRILDTAKKMEWNVAVAASTGAAASRIEGAITMHAFAGVRGRGYTVEQLDEMWRDGRSVPGNNGVWRDVDLAIFEEVSMTGAHFLEMLEWMSHHICPERSPFSKHPGERVYNCLTSVGRPKRMIVLAVGDFFQLRPVGSKFSFQSPAWDNLNFAVVNMTVSMRHANDMPFVSMLGRMRTGRMTDSDLKVMESRLLRPGHEAHDPATLIKNKTAEGAAFLTKHELLPTYIVTLHEKVKQINDMFYNAVPGSPLDTFTATDVFQRIVVQDGQRRYQNVDVREWPALRERFKTKIAKFDCVVPPVLYLKDGCQYVVTRNIDVSAGVVNGTRFKVIGGECWAPPLKEGNEWRQICLDGSRAAFKDTLVLEGGVVLRRTQHSLKYGYAITVHSSQGMTLDNAFVNLSGNVKSAGLQYVACSRVRSLKGLHLLVYDRKPARASPLVIEFYNRLRHEPSPMPETERPVTHPKVYPRKKKAGKKLKRKRAASDDGAEGVDPDSKESKKQHSSDGDGGGVLGFIINAKTTEGDDGDD